MIGNSKIEISLDATHGTVTQLRNKVTATSYLRPGASGNFRMVYSTPSFNGSGLRDPWSAVDGTRIDGSKQTISSVEFLRSSEGVGLRISYDRMHLEKRWIAVAVTYSVEVTSGSEETKWRMSIENGDEGTIREVHFPYISGLINFDSLVMPNHSGQLMRSPTQKLSDESPDLYLEYPARASMQWFDYYSSSGGLYLASYDKSLNYKSMHFGWSNGVGGPVAMWFVQFPFAVTSTHWTSPELGVGLHAGDWHWAGDTYGRWVESWVPRAKISSHALNMVDSDTDIMIKDVDESVQHNYDQAAQIAVERPVGAGSLFVGWHHNGHDTYYPEYLPIADLGGSTALVAAINAIHTRGRLVSAYVNLRLAAEASEVYQKDGHRWSVLLKVPRTGVATVDAAELREHWNTKWHLEPNGEGLHVVMCPSVKQWQDYILSEIGRVVRDYHFDGVFLDQVGSFYSELCYSPYHGHSNPANAWGPGYMTMLRRIREETRSLNPDSYLWIEGMNDAYSQFVDYELDKNPVWLPMRTHPEAETFPEMWRYTCPGLIIVNEPKSYSYAPSKDPVYGDSYFFVMGIRGYGMFQDFDDTNSRAGAERRKVIDKISRLWHAGEQFLLQGRYRDDVGLSVSPKSTFSKVYECPEGFAVPVWNTTSSEVETRVQVRLLGGGATAKPTSVTSLSSGRELPYEIADGVVGVNLFLAPHDIDAIIVRTAVGESAR